MEACYINREVTSQAIADIITYRYRIDLFHELIKEVGMKYIFNFIKEKAKKLENGEIKSNLETTNIIYKEEEWKFNEKSNKIFYFDTSKASNTLHDELYSLVIEQGLEDDFDTLLQKFDKNIKKFRIIKSQPKCNKNENGDFFDLNEFGDGLAKFISYLSLLLVSKNGILFLDEIENGIHYTNLDKLWEIILTISKQQNVQVFATTHSKECIESYARVAKKLEDEEITMIVLARNLKNELKALVYDDKMFYSELEQNHEVRGW
jgi:hypothetical protein